MKNNARNAAVSALCRLEAENGYSNIVLDRLLSAGRLSETDAALATRLFYGVLEHRMTLDHLVAPFCRKPVEKLDGPVRAILRCALYQLYYMDKIPAAVAVHQAVEQCREMGVTSASGFVNGVLRAVVRAGIAWPEQWPQGPAGLALRYSCPEEWIRLWQQSYGEETTAAYLESLQQPAPAVLRVNTLLLSSAQALERLRQAGIAASLHAELPDCLLLPPGTPAKALTAWGDTWYAYQDIASQWACAALAPQPGERVADVCAAPGGKTLCLAQRMQNRGEVVAFDLYENKCEALRQRAARMGATCVRVLQRDGRDPVPEALRGRFDRVLCDAPCSGLGVIRRKPEIRYKKPAEFADLPAQQLQILSQAAEMVRPGGVLQYSTCTLHPPENDGVADAFLRQHPDFAPHPLPIAPCFAAAGLPVGDRITLWPHQQGSDGFFIAGFIRKP